MSGSDRTPTAAATTPDKRAQRPFRAVVVGVGTVGLHRALAFDDADLDVVGYDVDESVVAKYRRGVDATGAVGDDRVADSDCAFTTNPACVADADFVFVAVPTRHADCASESLPAVRAAGETVGDHLTAGTTVVLESTVPPGGTADVFEPALEAASGFDAGDEFAVAYSPDRFSPGQSMDEWRARTKLVAAERASVARDVAALYERVYESVRVVSDPATAAAAKCVENVYRDVNIALVNELSAALDALDLDADAVLDAAATKWNVPRLDPGLVGGTCLRVDPHLFADRVATEGGSTPLVRTARSVNDAVPERVADVTVDALAERAAGLPDTGAPSVLLLGLTYKADVADCSGTQSVAVATQLRDRGVDVVGYDPLLSPDAADDALPFDVLSECAFDGVDGVVVLVGHEAFDDLALDDIAGIGSVPTDGRIGPSTTDTAGVGVAENAVTGPDGRTDSTDADSLAAPPVVVDVPRVFDRGRAPGLDVVYRCP